MQIGLDQIKALLVWNLGPLSILLRLVSQRSYESNMSYPEH